MAFFDNIGKKLSQAGQTAVQKTKEMTDIAKINGSISDEEKKISGAYYQIGKLYAEKHSTDCEEDFAAMIAGIAESQNKIAAYRKQIQDIKGVVRCEKCGAEVASGAAFCSACGAPMPAAQTPVDDSTIKCSGCGKMISNTMKFCTSCGKPLVEEAVSSEQPEVPKSESTGDAASAPSDSETIEGKVQKEQSVEKKCPSCGAALDEGVAFCTECGTKI